MLLAETVAMIFAEMYLLTRENLSDGCGFEETCLMIDEGLA
jgi:hypothetical protein